MSEFSEEGCFHGFVDVFDKEADDGFAGGFMPKFFRDAVFVVFLHDEDDIRPTEVILGKFYPGVVGHAAGTHLIMRRAGEHFFRSDTADFILSADEEDFFDWAAVH